MASWTPTVISLVLVVVVVQCVVLWWLNSTTDAYSDFTAMAERTRALAGQTSLGLFTLYAFSMALFGRNNPWKFVENLPFKPVYDFVRSLPLLAQPPGRSDLTYVYSWIHVVLAFIVPCAVFVTINTAIAVSLWDLVKQRRSRDFS